MDDIAGSFQVSAQNGRIVLTMQNVRAVVQVYGFKIAGEPRVSFFVVPLSVCHVLAIDWRERERRERDREREEKRREVKRREENEK